MTLVSYQPNRSQMKTFDACRPPEAAGIWALFFSRWHHRDAADAVRIGNYVRRWRQWVRSGSGDEFNASLHAATAKRVRQGRRRRRRQGRRRRVQAWRRALAEDRRRLTR